MSKKKKNNKKEKRADYDITPTPKQRKYVEERMKQAKQGRRNKKEAALKAGYSKYMANSVKANIESKKGFLKLMEEKLPDGKLLDYLAEDLKKKPQERLGELKLAADIKGWREKDINISTDNETIDLLRSIIDK